jgi:hypothetical protein
VQQLGSWLIFLGILKFLTKLARIPLFILSISVASMAVSLIKKPLH